MMSVGCLLLFDVSNLESFTILNQWFFGNSRRNDAFADDNELNARVFTVIGISNDFKDRVIEY